MCFKTSWCTSFGLLLIWKEQWSVRELSLNRMCLKTYWCTSFSLLIIWTKSIGVSQNQAKAKAWYL